MSTLYPATHGLIVLSALTANVACGRLEFHSADATLDDGAPTRDALGPSDDASDGNPRVTDAAMAATRCLATETEGPFSTDFTTAPVNFATFGDADVAFATATGETTITYLTAPSGTAYSGILSAPASDFRRRRIALEITRFPVAVGHDLLLSVGETASDLLELKRSREGVGAILRVHRWNPTATLVASDIPRAGFRFWQMRETNGLIVVEVSSDGTTWQVIAEQPTYPSFAAATLTIAFGGTAPSGQVAITDIRDCILRP